MNKTKTGKRILEVTIKRMIDEDPDTSWLGKYSQRATSEFSIDRAHSEDCESLKPEFKADGEWSSWNGSSEDMLEQIRAFLEENKPECLEHVKPQELFCGSCADETAYKEAIETVWALEKEATECDCNGGDMQRHEYRYFNPSFNYIDKNGRALPENTPEEVRKYVRQDYDRMESLNHGNWCFIGIRAHARIWNSQTQVTQDISSGGLWGIESDGGKEHIEETEKEELAGLRTELLSLGFSSRAISTAFKNVERKDA